MQSIARSAGTAGTAADNTSTDATAAASTVTTNSSSTTATAATTSSAATAAASCYANRAAIIAASIRVGKSVRELCLQACDDHRAWNGMQNVAVAQKCDRALIRYWFAMRRKKLERARTIYLQLDGS